MSERLAGPYPPGFFDKFTTESDRACAVLAGALLDSVLERLLWRAMVPDSSQELFRAQGPLGSFAAKLDLAFALGLISREDHTELTLVRRIRNDFAHHLDHELNFTTAHIVDRVRALQLPRIITEYNHRLQNPFAEEYVQDVRESLRRCFEITVAFLTAHVNDRIKDVTAPTAREPVVVKFDRSGDTSA
jgi:DNA-binding MltR family transcriptional regulator